MCLSEGSTQTTYCCFGELVGRVQCVLQASIDIALRDTTVMHFKIVNLSGGFNTFNTLDCNLVLLSVAVVK